MLPMLLTCVLLAACRSMLTDPVNQPAWSRHPGQLATVCRPEYYHHDRRRLLGADGGFERVVTLQDHDVTWPKLVTILQHAAAVVDDQHRQVGRVSIEVILPLDRARLRVGGHQG